MSILKVKDPTTGEWIPVSGGGGGAADAADWNAAEGEPGYIKNRTHWAEGSKTELLPETALTQEEGVFPINQPVPLVVGEHYIVNWNGVEYAATAYDMNIFEFPNGAPALINDGANLDTGEGAVFIIQVGTEPVSADIPYYGLAADIAGATMLTLAIYAGAGTVHKLAGKFLPIGTPYIENEGTFKTILPETTHAVSKAGVEMPLPPFTVGKEYLIVWNGTEYRCIAQSYAINTAATYIGNAKLFGENDSGDPFLLASGSGQGIVAALDGSTEATFSIAIDSTVIHKLDERLMPDDSATKEYVDNTAATLQGLIDGKVSAENAELTGNVSISGSFSMNRNPDTIVGYESHTEGVWCAATGTGSHAEGEVTVASGIGSHAEGDQTVAASKYQHVQGRLNITDDADKYAHIVGNGTALVHSNAHTLDWDGNAWFQGDVYVGSTSGTNRDEGSKKLATEDWVNALLAAIPNAAEVAY